MRTMSILFLALLSSVGLARCDELALREAERRGDEIRARWTVEPPFREADLVRSGVRRLEGKHLILFTDLPASPEVAELPTIFDAMIPLLCDYFGLNPKKYDSFKVEGFLIDDFEKFKPSGAVDQVEKLRNGYAWQRRIWLRNQTSPYYRRHLLLHEGVHAFMAHAFGAWGPPWYREGTAELLATHRWENGTLTLAHYPDSPEELQLWGRIEIAQKDYSKKKGKTVRGIFELASEDYDANEAYAWSWTFAAFCEHHAKYREVFRKTAYHLTLQPDKLVERFREMIGEDAWPDFEDDWFDFMATLEYGFDFKRTEITDYLPGNPLQDAETEVVVRSDRGWQNTGIRLDKGMSYRFKTSGSVTLAEKPAPWVSEPSGITLKYYRGAPLGVLLGTLVTDGNETNESFGVGFSRPKLIGLGGVWTPDATGTLFLRINDSPAELSDNDGVYTIKIQKEASMKTN